ncbi:50S ribosomal protein L17 [Candidatus Falkowbacteria bacterium CG10_big_fil_rev_8_21_14_0_10_39_9]|uniref:Large ribosomal subunit protein bL17 n=1 Tax=Candidatus Falkowbacteria bacterium CG10_big_fil_rev_8_21_14_0_10_39_9 TaxID=1974566 RepID=A0A2M6WNR7_9BACT|nr:MAG: 50S ribosomal protein L17 [Candidatus Falkowbacteria bacterium CG10_big_fil_rev_8_21_14_0_10_39_9]
MRHKNKVKTLDRPKDERELMLRNMASSVLLYEKITTTEAKAKVVKPLVERLITIAKTGNLNSRRKLIQILLQKKAVKKSMEVLGERYKTRNGGYTRIIRLGNREGDGAKMVQLELV